MSESNVTLQQLLQELAALDAEYNSTYTTPESILALEKTIKTFNITITDWNTLVDYANTLGSIIAAMYTVIPDLADYVIQNNKVDKLTTEGLHVYSHNGETQSELPASASATADTVAIRTTGGSLIVGTPLSDTHATTKGYVDAADATKVTKTSSSDKVYATDENGAQTTIPVENYPGAEGVIVRRSALSGHVGQIIVPITPVNNGEAASKAYVDSTVSNAVTSALVYKGSISVADLNNVPIANLKTGDFYNITTDGILTHGFYGGGGGSVEVMAGDNVAWTGSNWDKMTMDLSIYDDKFIAAGFFEVQSYNSFNGTITFVYSSDLYTMTYDTDTGVLTITAN